LWALYRNNPYGYYILLRWIVCAILIYCAIVTYRLKNNGWTWIFGINAVIYNPIFRLALGRSIWTFVNIASIIMIVISFFSIKQQKLKSNPD
jgi:hypothetical protein